MIPNARPVRVPVEQTRAFQCECGCDEFEPMERVRILYDRMKPKQCGMEPVVKLRCVNCKKLMQFDDDGAARLEAHAARASEGTAPVNPMIQNNGSANGKA